MARRRRLLAAICVAAGVLVAVPSSASGQQCIQDDEDRAFALYSESRTHYQQGRFGEAIDLLEHAYTICPIPVLLYNLARSHEAKGDLAIAIDVYERFLRADPETPDRVGIERRIETMRAQLRTEPSEQRTVSPLPFVVAGVGVVGVAAGAVLGVLAEATADDARNEPVHAEKVVLAGRADDLALGTNIAFVVGGVVTLAGVAWAIFEVLGASREEEESLSLGLSPEGGTAVWSRTF